MWQISYPLPIVLVLVVLLPNSWFHLKTVLNYPHCRCEDFWVVVVTSSPRNHSARASRADEYIEPLLQGGIQFIGTIFILHPSSKRASWWGDLPPGLGAQTRPFNLLCQETVTGYLCILLVECVDFGCEGINRSATMAGTGGLIKTNQFLTV